MMKTVLGLISILHLTQARIPIEDALCPSSTPSSFQASPTHTVQGSAGFGDGKLQYLTPAQAPLVRNNSASCSFNSYTALGDSYAVGLGSKQRLRICEEGELPSSSVCTSAQCAKDIGSYGYRFAQEFNIQNFQYLACSGADTTAVYESQVASPYFGTPDLVSLTVGGDDYHIFFQIIVTCLLLEDAYGTCSDDIAYAIWRLGYIAKNVRNLLSEIKAKVPSTTKVVVPGYVRPFGLNSPGDPGDYCPAGVGEWYDKNGVNAIVETLNQQIQDAAKEYGFLYADVDTAAWDGHHWCDTGPAWFDYTLCVQQVDTGGKDYFNTAVGHPTYDGQGAYLQAMKDALGC